jgi:hypothetical protein
VKNTVLARNRYSSGSAKSLKAPVGQSLALNADAIFKEDDWNVLFITMREMRNIESVSIWSNHGNQKILKELQSAKKRSCHSVGNMSPALIKAKLQAELAKTISYVLTNFLILESLDLSGIKLATPSLRLLSSVNALSLLLHFIL